MSDYPWIEKVILSKLFIQTNQKESGIERAESIMETPRLTLIQNKETIVNMSLKTTRSRKV